ncbi:TonB family protein [Bacteroides sp.]|uniref:TonB family protein n=1 Tax=Bacteroides sp. TaxID=29523 RepID=UPI00261FA348|nr:TonB family protein [Bacteroides sp.]MDD3038479.1 TonB family protein [Bacteroides sp.]
MKTKLVCLILILCGCLSLSAQHMPKVDENGVYFVAEKMPEFTGGQQALMKYLSTNVQYPAEAQKNGIGGRVIVQFVIMEDGSIAQEKIVRGVEPSLDAEALRLVKQMPKWIPGTEQGVPVKVRYNVPIFFRMTEGSISRLKSDLVLPVGQEVKNAALEGVWQSCSVKTIGEEYHIYRVQVLKILSSDGTFMNIFTGDNKAGVVITASGTYQKESENTYVETLEKSAIDLFKEGSKNSITFEFLNDNLVKFTFSIPGKDTPWEEYWFRVPLPEIKLVAE